MHKQQILCFGFYLAAFEEKKVWVPVSMLVRPLDMWVYSLVGMVML